MLWKTIKMYKIKIQKEMHVFMHKHIYIQNIYIQTMLKITLATYHDWIRD
jgi:hypothetical protein